MCFFFVKFISKLEVMKLSNHYFNFLFEVQILTFVLQKLMVKINFASNEVQYLQILHSIIALYSKKCIFLYINI